MRIYCSRLRSALTWRAFWGLFWSPIALALPVGGRTERETEGGRRREGMRGGGREGERMNVKEVFLPNTNWKRDVKINIAEQETQEQKQAQRERSIIISPPLSPTPLSLSPTDIPLHSLTPPPPAAGSCSCS